MKNFRNRIGDLKKYGVINLDKENIYNPSEKIKNNMNNERNVSETISLLKKENRIISKISIIFGLIGLVYALLATPYYQSTTTMYPALESDGAGSILEEV